LSQEATENEARGCLTLTAARTGRPSALNSHPGQTLLSLVPEAAGQDKKKSALEAQLYAPSRTAGFVKPSQVAWLAYSYQIFGMAEGVVQSISQTPIAPQD